MLNCCQADERIETLMAGLREHGLCITLVYMAVLMSGRMIFQTQEVNVMNRLYVMMMVVLVLGLTTSNVSADCALHAKNLAVEYNELSAAEFFYGIAPDHRNDATETTKNLYAVIPGESSPVADPLIAPEFFYGHSIPDRLETTYVICDISPWGGTVSKAIFSAVSNPADFFGYTNDRNCSNC
jgi:hypothetical protein